MEVEATMKIQGLAYVFVTRWYGGCNTTRVVDEHHHLGREGGHGKKTGDGLELCCFITALRYPKRRSNRGVEQINMRVKFA